MPSSRSTTTCIAISCFVFVFLSYSRFSGTMQDQLQYGKSRVIVKPLDASTSPNLENEQFSSLTVKPTTSIDEVPDSGDDETIGGEPAISYFRRLALSTGNLLSRTAHSNQKMQVLASYAYKDHFSATLSVAKETGAIAWCRYIGKDGKEVAEPVESRVYPFFVVYCSRRNKTTMLGVTNNKNDPVTTENSAKLIRRKFKEYQHHVSFCLAPIYGTEPKWLHFVELVEHYKLQNVNKFFVYIRETNDYDRKLINSYVETGEVEIIEIPATVSDVIFQQLMSVADCLLRSRTYSKWSIFADIDERLIMTDDRMTIDEFMRSIKDETIGSVAFPQRWIMKREQSPSKFVNDQQIIEKMPTRAWHETTSAAMKGHPACMKQTSCWAKDIVHNEKVIRMLVHEVETFYPGFKELFLNSSVGYIRHYRDVDMQTWEKNNRANLLKLGPISNTTYPLSTGTKLLKNVLIRLHKVYD